MCFAFSLPYVAKRRWANTGLSASAVIAAVCGHGPLSCSQQPPGLLLDSDLMDVTGDLAASGRGSSRQWK